MAAALAACERRRSAKSALALSAKMARERVPAHSKVERKKKQVLPPKSCRYVKIYTYQEHLDCFAPPLGDSTTPPSHWPEGFQVSTLPRVAWLPPGWGQAFKEDCDRKFYVAPEHLGSRAMVNKLNVELTVGKKLKPADQHGFILGDDYVKKWPPWLPKDWRIAYFRSAGGSLKPCFLSPTGVQYNNKKEVLAKKKEEITDKRVGLKALASRPQGAKTGDNGKLRGGFAQRLARKAAEKKPRTARTARGRRKMPKPEPKCFRTFTSQELIECFAPPLGDSLTPPSHWPEGLKVSRLPRISWLPPNWGQAYRDGLRRKLYVAPPGKGSRVVFHRENVERIEGRRLYPMDQHGLHLGHECITQWPGWLPKDWMIGYFKVRDTVKVCFLSPKGARFQDRKGVLDSLNPDRGKRKPTKLNPKRKRKPKKKPINIVLGEFAHRMAFKLRQRAIFSLRDSPAFHAEGEDELPDTCDIFRSFTYEEFDQCFAPPLGDVTTPPAHWPEGLEVCTLPRISWLPPGWGQGIRIGQKGRRLKVFVAPEGHGRLVVNNKQNMEVILQTRLRPLDQHGKLLGLGDECIERWPIWLPKTWRIAYYKEQGEVRPCFVSPSGVRCSKRSKVLAEAQQQKAVDEANAAEADRLSKRKRLRKAEVVEVDNSDDDAEAQVDRIQALVADDSADADAASNASAVRRCSAPIPVNSATKRKRLRPAQVGPEQTAGTLAPHAVVRVERRPHVQILSGTPSGLDVSKLSEADREWLTNHPLYIKIHHHGYPLPFGDQDILALKAFTPKESGGEADFTFY